MNPRQGCEDECNWLRVINSHPLQELDSQRKAPEKNPCQANLIPYKLNGGT